MKTYTDQQVLSAMIESAETGLSIRQWLEELRPLLPDADRDAIVKSIQRMAFYEIIGTIPKLYCVLAPDETKELPPTPPPTAPCSDRRYTDLDVYRALAFARESMDDPRLIAMKNLNMPRISFERKLKRLEKIGWFKVAAIGGFLAFRYTGPSLEGECENIEIVL